MFFRSHIFLPHKFLRTKICPLLNWGIKQEKCGSICNCCGPNYFNLLQNHQSNCHGVMGTNNFALNLLMFSEHCSQNGNTIIVSSKMALNIVLKMTISKSVLIHILIFLYPLGISSSLTSFTTMPQNVPHIYAIYVKRRDVWLILFLSPVTKRYKGTIPSRLGTRAIRIIT